MQPLRRPAEQRRVDDLIEFSGTEAVGGLHRDAETHRHDEPGKTPRIGVARKITLVDGTPEALLKADPRVVAPVDKQVVGCPALVARRQRTLHGQTPGGAAGRGRGADRSAKERQGHVNARLGQLRQRLRELSMIDMSRIPRDRVGLGSNVVVLDLDKDEEITYNLVTSEDADVAKGRISTTSPIGRGLLGKKVGETVKIQIPDGTRELEILKLTTIHDGAP